MKRRQWDGGVVGGRDEKEERREDDWGRISVWGNGCESKEGLRGAWPAGLSPARQAEMEASLLLKMVKGLREEKCYQSEIAVSIVG